MISRKSKRRKEKGFEQKPEIKKRIVLIFWRERQKRTETETERESRNLP